MQYYRTDIALAVETDKDSAKELDKRFQLKLNDTQLLPQDSFIFISEVNGDQLIIGGLSNGDRDMAALTSGILDALSLAFSISQTSEITLNQLGSLVSAAPGEHGYVEKGIQKLNAQDLIDVANGDYYGGSFEFKENLLEDGISKEALAKQADNQLFAQSFAEELARIEQGQSVAVQGGHPVHYLIFADDSETRNALVHTLLQALYTNGRLKSKRSTSIQLEEGRNYSHNLLKAFYKAAAAGSLVFELAPHKKGGGQYANAHQNHIEELCGLLLEHKHDVLSIFCCSLGSALVKEAITANCEDTVFIELRETTLRCSEARAFLKSLAAEKGMRADQRLYKGIAMTGDDGYLAADLRKRFERWFDARLLDTVYPQYRAANSAMARTAVKPKGSAFAQLEAMVGLQVVKTVIKQAVDYNRARALFAAKGFKDVHATMHMVFTGNPGTAKTTIARLFAQIMKDNGVLERGNLIECGRADIVGKYVGWTAPAVKELFEKAAGSVLFIDEAYSLLDDREGMYGDEAINTIVQEMENCREKTIVILAGYPHKMEQFLSRNPGLESRIAHHVAFADYDAGELLAIAELQVRSQQRVLAEGCGELLLKHFESAQRQRDFGNGRYVRNLVEQAIVRQASRLLTMSPEDVKEDDVRLLTSEDFVLDGAASANMRGRAARCPERKIGFC
jgi:adenylate kinase family enzyme